jgi:hypothetical protein
MKQPKLNLIIIDPHFNSVAVELDKADIAQFYRDMNIDIANAKRNKGKRELYARINEFIAGVEKKKGED